MMNGGGERFADCRGRRRRVVHIFYITIWIWAGFSYSCFMVIDFTLLKIENKCLGNLRLFGVKFNGLKLFLIVFSPFYAVYVHYTKYVQCWLLILRFLPSLFMCAGQTFHRFCRKLKLAGFVQVKYVKYFATTKDLS